MRWSGRLLVAVAWASAAIFGAYIIVHYAAAAPLGVMNQWNETLPRLYQPRTPAAVIGIGAHFLTGGALLLLGPIQLIAAIRNRAPAVHRWIGRVYVAAAAIAGLGGLAFIAAEGTVGGPLMAVGFSIYGALMVLAAVQTYRHGRARRLEAHRAWAIRLFALAVGSWLYRMDYGFWSLLAHGAGHTQTFDGSFDAVMDFAFYVPNLVLAEAFIRARGLRAHPALKGAAAVLLLGAAGFLVLGTYYFTLYYWGPGIAARLPGL